MATEEKRMFEVLPDGKVRCNMSCLSRRSEMQTYNVNGRLNVCTAIGSPLLEIGKMSEDTPVVLGRVCVLAGQGE